MKGKRGLSADWQELREGEHYIQGPVGKRTEGLKGSKKYLKKYFAEAEKIATFAAPQEGKEKAKETGGARPMGIKKKEDAVQRCDGIPPEAGSVSGEPGSSLKK